MSTLFLSLLLLVLVAAGLLMARPVREHFESSMSGVKPMTVSPALVNIMVTPTINASAQPDMIARGLDEQRSGGVWKKVAADMRADCKSLDKGFYEDNLEACKVQCNKNKSCNLINYDSDAGPSCFTQSCSNLNKIPYESNKFPGSEVWTWVSSGSGSLMPSGSSSLMPTGSGSGSLMPTSGSLMPTSGSLMPSGSGSLMPSGTGTVPMAPAAAKCPKCESCPDMSQYIRMDEIPCWNCSLP